MVLVFLVMHSAHLSFQVHSPSTLTGSMLIHLSEKHHILQEFLLATPMISGSVSVSNLRQPMLNQFISNLKPEAMSKFHNAVVTYIVMSELPHSISESDPFKEFIKSICPGYTPKLA